MSASEPDHPPASFSTGRRWLIGVNVFLKIVAFLAVVVMINYLAAGHFRRWQWAGGSIYKLSPPTVAVLGGLTNDISITIFFSPQGDNEQIYGLTAALLKEYENACPRHLHVRTLDYSREDSEARDFLSRHQIAGLKEKDFVFVEGRGQSQTIYARDLADYDFSDLLAHRSQYVRRSAFRGESYFTGAIYSVGYGEPTRAYFLGGHGERDPGDPGDAAKNDGMGVTQLASILKTEVNCSWAKLLLAGTNEIPPDCQLLIIAGPADAELTSEEIDKINSYMSKGGRLLALADSPLDSPLVHSALGDVLKIYNIGMGDKFVVDTDKQYQIGRLEFLTEGMQQHPITDPLIADNAAIRMSAPRPVYLLNKSAPAPGAPQIWILAHTSDKGLYDTQLGEYGLIVAVEQGAIPGVTVSHTGTRLVAAGDVDFLDDRNINSAGNHLFASLALKWLLYQPQLAVEGVPPRPIHEYRLYLTKSQSSAVHWLFLGAMPGAVLGLGGLVWLRRRS